MVQILKVIIVSQILGPGSLSCMAIRCVSKSGMKNLDGTDIDNLKIMGIQDTIKLWKCLIRKLINWNDSRKFETNYSCWTFKIFQAIDESLSLLNPWGKTGFVQQSSAFYVLPSNTNDSVRLKNKLSSEQLCIKTKISIFIFKKKNNDGSILWFYLDYFYGSGPKFMLCMKMKAVRQPETESWCRSLATWEKFNLQVASARRAHTLGYVANIHTCITINGARGRCIAEIDARVMN
jgi:hypothetical protein